MPAEIVSRYNWEWDPDLSELEIELTCIRFGGRWSVKRRKAGNGLLFHYKQAMSLIWPEDDHHRWSDLMLDYFLKETIIVVQGPKDSSKSRTAAKFALVDYWAFPDETLIMVSSTEMRGADYRIWGDLKSLLVRARERYPWLPGKVLEAKHAICTDDLEDAEVRDPRKGLVFIPCFGSGGAWVGLSRYAGIKQKRRRLLGDEVQFMLAPYIDVLSNIQSGDFKGMFLGNTIGQGDPFDRLGEPVAGWGSEGEITKTTVWRNKFGGVTICLYGPDSPNFDYPQPNGQKHFSYLIGQKDIDWVANSYGKDSHTYWMQVMGVRRAGLTARRVITETMCKQFGAFGPVVWSGGDRTMVAGLDAAYGGVGGDRCILIVGEFGQGPPEFAAPTGVIQIPLQPAQGTSKVLLKVYPPFLVPVSVQKPGLPEDQIAEFCKKTCENLSVPPQNFFFDGRGTMAMSLAKIWSPLVNAVEFGGPATQRPVSADHFIWDPELRMRRPKRCDEEYSKFVTELWFSVAYTIQSGQMRELPPEVALEGSQREWKLVRGDRREVETKEDMKERTNRSPDYFDALVTMVEGARRRGFVISKMGNAKAAEQSRKWLEDMADKARKVRRSGELTYSS